MSYTIPTLLDIDNYLAYSTATTPTTNEDMQDFLTNQNITIKNLVAGGGLWQPNTEYAVGTVVRSPNQIANTLALVTVAGTTGSSEPSWSAADTTVVDGGVTYKIRKHVLSASDLMSDILLAAHPIGEYYYSKNPKSPALLFGGTWEQVKDKFIYAAGTKGVGSTGGSENVTLTINQIPTHTHSASADTQGNHTHTVTSSASNGNGVSWAEPSSGPAGYAVSSGTSNTTSTNGAHSHNITVQTGGGHSHNINVGDNGGGQAHENMPPYIVAYCWCRTA